MHVRANPRTTSSVYTPFPDFFFTPVFLCLMLFLLVLLKDKRDCPSTLRCTSELFFLLRASCMCTYSNDASSTPLVVPSAFDASKLDRQL